MILIKNPLKRFPSTAPCTLHVLGGKVCSCNGCPWRVELQPPVLAVVRPLSPTNARGARYPLQPRIG